jgi:hypothetical protein
VRRLTLLLVPILLLPIACGDDDDGTIDGAGDPTTTVAGGAGTTASESSASTAPPTTSSSGETATTAGPPTPIEVDTGGPPGSAAPFYLRPSPADTIVLEVIAEEGAEPGGGTLAHLAGILGSATGKPVETGDGARPPSRESWTAADLRAAADAAAIVPQGDRAVVRLLFVHGHFADAENVLGIAVRADVAAIFSDEVEASADVLVSAGSIEAAVSTHEIGHLLGLVDLHLKTGREDPEHPGHSTNRNSVMYWAVESTLVTDLLTGGPPKEFDEADLADLAAIRNG